MSLFFILQVTFFVASCNASQAFVWGFGNNFLSTTFAECQTLSIVVSSLNGDGVTFGVPPYYMMAFESGGVPTTDLVGTDRTALQWVVRHAAGSTLMLNMVDSNGSAGGVPQTLFTVGAGKTDSCLPPAPESQFVVTANVTESLTTCQPWGLTIKGGVKPYNLTLAELNSPFITNVTLGALDDAFTYIDRADPNRMLIAAISDANGVFASGTPLVKTQGSTNVTCPGLSSSSGSAATDQADRNAAASGAANGRGRTNTIIAVVVVLLSFLLIAGGTLAFLHVRKRRAVVNGQGSTPHEEAGIAELEISAPMMFAPGSGRESASSSSSSKRLLLPNIIPSICPPNCDYDLHRSSSGHPSRFPSTRSQSSEPQRQSKPLGAFTRSANSISRPPRAELNTRDVEPNIIIQHRDGGVVQELPPPYLDRSRPPDKS